MKVAVFSAHVLWPTHYETELEIIQKHLDKKDSVYHIYCNGALLPCDLNLDKNKNKCAKCIERRVSGQELLEGNFEKIKLNPIKKDSFKFENIEEIKNIEELKKLKYDNFDIGFAIASSLISLFRDPELSVKDNHKLIKQLLENAKNNYTYFQNLIQKINPDLIYIFNGRFIYERALFRVCQKLNIKVMIHDRVSSINKYMLFENYLPHNIKNIDFLIKKTWDASNLIFSEKKQIGVQFFEERNRGIDQSWYSFVKNQKRNKLPDNWDRRKKNIVIFNSSEDEFAAIGEEWNRGFYKSQYEGIMDILLILDTYKLSNYCLYLRMHPNLTNVENEDVKRLKNIDNKNINIIFPESEISSYELLLNSDLVITFGSTIGVEATFYERVSILIGSAFYMNLDVTYNPQNRNDLIELLKKDLLPKDQINSIKYGYYMKTFGLEYDYYKPSGLFDGLFKEKKVYKPKKYPFVLRILHKMNRFVETIYNLLFLNPYMYIRYCIIKKML